MTSRKALLFGLLCLFLVPSPSRAQVATDEVYTGEASGTLYSAIMPLGFPRSYLFANGNFGERPGVLNDYFTTGAFFPMQVFGPDQVFFLEGQVWITEQNGKTITGGTAGGGQRWLFWDNRQLIGVNAFATWDESGNRNNYDGAGVGVEWLSNWLGVTANTYIPWTRRVRAIGALEVDKDQSFFTGPNLAFRTFQPVEEQLLGYDIEIGSAIPKAEFISLYAGAYHFEASQDNDFSGISGRARLDFTNAVVNVTVSDDDRFGTTVNVSGELRIGDGPISLAPRANNLDNQMFDRVRRRSRIAMLEYIRTGSVLATDPNDPTGNTLLTFLHIDNTADPGGDGTFNNRFDELSDINAADAANFILVHRGDTAAGGPFLAANGGAFLQDGEVIVGEGFDQLMIETGNFPGVFCPLPGFGDGGPNPFIEGTAGDVLTLANNNQVLGLNIITPAGGAAIAGEDITDVLIDRINSDIDVAGGAGTGAGSGIMLTNVDGTATILNTGFGLTTDTTPGDMIGDGAIVISNEDVATPLDVIINNDDTQPFFGNLAFTGGEFGISINADNSVINVDGTTTAGIEDVTADSNSIGLNLMAINSGEINATVADSNFTNAGAFGIKITEDNDALIDLQLDTVSTFDAAGTMLGAGDDSIHVDLRGNSDLLLTAIDSNFNGPNDGMAGAFDPNGDDNGLDVFANEGSTFTMDFTNTTFEMSSGSAFALDLDGNNATMAINNTIGFMTLDTVSLADAGGNAIQIDADETAMLGMTGIQVSAPRAGVDAFNISNIDAIVTIDLTDSGMFEDATDDGLDIFTMSDDSQAETLITILDQDGMGNPVLANFSNFGGNGVNILTDGALGRTELDFGFGADLSQDAVNTALDTINITSDNGGMSFLDAANIVGDNAGEDAISLQANGGGIRVDITDSGSFTAAGRNDATGDGVDIANDAGTVILLLGDSGLGTPFDFTGAAQNGFASNTLTNGMTSVNLNSGAIFDTAGTDAIQVVQATGMTTIVGGSQISGAMAGGDGFDLDNTGGVISIDLNDVTDFSGAGQTDIMGDGIDSDVTAGTTTLAINTNSGGIADFTGAAQDGLFTSTTGSMIGSATQIELGDAGNPGGGADFSGAGSNAMHIDSFDADTVNVIGNNVHGAMAGSDAILVNADNTAGTANANVDLILTNTGDFSMAGQTDAGGDGLEVNATAGSDVAINISGVNGTRADFSSAAQNGVLALADDSLLDITLTEVNLNTAMGGDGADLEAVNAATLTFTGTDISASGVADDAFELTSIDNVDGDTLLTLNLLATDPGTPNDFTLSGDDGVDFFGDGVNDGSFVLNINDSNFDDAMGAGTGSGIIGDVINGTLALNINDVTLNNAAGFGFSVFADSSVVSNGVAGTMTNIEANDAGIAGFDLEAVDTAAAGGSMVDLTIDGLDAQRSGVAGLAIVTSDVGTMATLNINNLNVDDAGDFGAIGLADSGSALNLDIANFSANRADADGSVVDSILGGGILGGGGGGIDLIATGAGTVLTGSLDTGTTQDAGITQEPVSTGVPRLDEQLTGEGSFGVRISALDGAEIGSSGTGATGIFITDLLSGNSALEDPDGDGQFDFAMGTDETNITQDHGLLINADGNAFVDVRLDDTGVGTGTSNLRITGNEFSGVIVNSNIDTTNDPGVFPAGDESFVDVFFNGGVINLNGGDGVRLLSDNSADLDADLTTQEAGINIALTNTELRVNTDEFIYSNPPVDPMTLPFGGADMDPAAPGEIGYGLNAIANSGYINVNFDGTDLSNNEEGEFNATGMIINFTFNNLTLTEGIMICADPGQVISQTFNNVTINGPFMDPDQAAISMRAEAGGTAIGNFNNVTINDVEAQALAFLANGGNIIADFNGFLDINNTSYGTPTGMAMPTIDTKTGLELDAVLQGVVQNDGASIGTADISFENITIDNTGVNGPTLVNALDIDVLDVGGVGAANTLALTIDGMTVNDTNAQAGEGELDVILNDAAQSATIDLTDVTADNSTGIGINLDASAGGSFDIVNLDTLSANNAAEEGLRLIGDLVDANNTVGLQNSSFNDAGGRGVTIDVDIAADTVFGISNTTADRTTSTGGGIDLLVDATAGGSPTINIDGVSAQNAQVGDGLNIDLFGLGAATTSNINLTSLSGVNDFSGAAADGVNIDVAALAAGAMANLNVDGLNANNAGEDGVDVNLSSGGITLDVPMFNNVNATGAIDHGVTVQVTNPTNTLTSFIADTVNVDNAGMNGIELIVEDQVATTSIGLNNVIATNAGTPAGGAIIVPVPGDGVFINLDNVGALMTNTLAFNNVNASGSTAGDGIDLTLDNMTVAEIATFDMVTTQDNEQTGIRITVDNASALNTFAATGLDLSNNSQLSTVDAGMIVNVTNASTADFDLTDLVIDNTLANFGAGVILNVQDTSTLGFDILGTSIINNTGQEGIDIEVGTDAPLTSAATFTGTFDGLSITDSGNSIDAMTNNMTNGIDLDVAGPGTSATLSLDTVVVDNSLSGDGLNFIVSDAALLDVTLTEVQSINNHQGGLEVFATGVGTEFILTSMTPMGGMVNTFNDNGFPLLNNDDGHGVDIRLEDMVEATLQLEASANNNAGDGIRVTTDGSGVTLNSLGISATNVNVDNNGGDGLHIDLDNVMNFTSFDLSGAMVNDNAGDQIFVRIANMDVETISFNEIIADGRRDIDPMGAMGDGIEFTLDNANITTLLGLNNIQAVDNGEDGLQVNLLNGATIPAGSAIDLTPGVMQDSEFSRNGANGINIVLDASDAELDILNSQINFNRTSTIANNVLDGVNIELNNASSLIAAIDSQVIDSNGGAGAMISTSDESFYSTGTGITNNEITNNGSFGIRGVFLNTTMDTVQDAEIMIGDPLMANQGNLLDGNADAAIALDFIQATTAEVAIVDNIITNTVDNGIAAFNGEAIFIRMLGLPDPDPATNLLNVDGTGVMDSDTTDQAGLLIRGNSIGVDINGMDAPNAATGVAFDVRERSNIDGIFIINNTISNAQSGDGVNFTRIDEVIVNDFFIDENIIANNADDGIEIIGENDNNDPLSVVIGLDGQRDGMGGIIGTDAINRGAIVNWLNTLDGNLIQNNGNDGLAFQVNADANLNVDLQENFIIDNNADGIQLTEIAIGGDLRQITGLWDQNVVSNNAGKGLRMRANVGNGAGITVTDGIIGAVIDQFGGVMSEGNGSTGAYLFGPGTYVFDDIDFVRNGISDQGNLAQGHGMDIEGVVSSVTVSNSLFRENFRDGIEIRSGGQATETTVEGGNLTFTQTGFAMDVTLIDNRITDNRGRGIDAINAMDSFLTLSILGTDDPRGGNPTPNSEVSSNDEEGIYVVNTASQNQDQSSEAGATLLEDGLVTRDGHIDLIITQTDISDNGNAIPAQANNLPASGVVIRVGTMDGNYSLIGAGPTDEAGFFASDGNFVGGIEATIHSNNLQGNFGDDIFVHSFVSTTEALPTVGGNWTDMEFTPGNTGRGDPLSRFDLTWGVGALVNTFDTVRFLNVGLDGTPNGQAGAFYNDGDGTFKSRTVNNQNPPIGGPFTSATRRRNATRLALRNYDDFNDGDMVVNRDILRPTATPNPNDSMFPFLYPGMGSSTFRVSATSGNNLDLIFTANGFETVIFDDDPRFGGSGDVGDFLIDDILDINGVFFTGTIFGELPFGWGTF